MRPFLYLRPCLYGLRKEFSLFPGNALSGVSWLLQLQLSFDFSFSKKSHIQAAFRSPLGSGNMAQPGGAKHQSRVTIWESTQSSKATYPVDNFLCKNWIRRLML
jgi:hypothetical protein